MNLAVIIPALNEQDCIGPTLRRIPPGLARQLIVVDNGSTDQTAARARAAGAQLTDSMMTVVAEPRRGYGQACLTGLAHLHQDIEAVAFLDADGSDDPALLTPMLESLANGAADLVLGARQLGDARQNLPPQQRFGNWLASSLIRWRWGHRFADLGPLRAIRRKSLESLRLTDTTWGWNVEMQIKAIRHGLRIREIPVPYGRRQQGRSKISGTVAGTVRAGTRILVTIARQAVGGDGRLQAHPRPCRNSNHHEAKTNTGNDGIRPEP